MAIPGVVVNCVTECRSCRCADTDLDGVESVDDQIAPAAESLRLGVNRVPWPVKASTAAIWLNVDVPDTELMMSLSNG